ncbi:MAG: hypothetical protein AAFN30_16810, partial [Actinomycetota bacterium]
MLELLELDELLDELEELVEVVVSVVSEVVEVSLLLDVGAAVVADVSLLVEVGAVVVDRRVVADAGATELLAEVVGVVALSTGPLGASSV